MFVLMFSMIDNYEAHKKLNRERCKHIFCIYFIKAKKWLMICPKVENPKGYSSVSQHWQLAHPCGMERAVELEDED